LILFENDGLCEHVIISLVEKLALSTVSASSTEDASRLAQLFSTYEAVINAQVNSDQGSKKDLVRRHIYTCIYQRGTIVHVTIALSISSLLINITHVID
jgi:hypothetical protein